MNESFILTAPNIIGLPAIERGGVVAPATYEIVEVEWPTVERLLRDGQISDAIALMEKLAMAMRDATATDADLFQESLTLARRILYDDLSEVGRSAGCHGAVHSALLRCAVWDKELQPYLSKLILR